MQPNMFIRPVFIAFITYCLTIGATFNGLFVPQVTALTLPLLALVFAAWLLMRLWGHRRGHRSMRWYRTPLDAPLVLWGGAIAVSFIMNLSDWRRMLIGVWFVGIYMLIWFILTDLLHNRRLRRSTLVDAVLCAGVLIVGFGFWQVLNVVLAGWRYPDGLFGLPRPVSLIGNANSLGAILVVLVGFTAGRFFSIERTVSWQRGLVGIYLLLTLLLLALTYSRGAWLGAGVALGVMAVLWALHHGIHSPAQVIGMIRTQPGAVQLVIGGLTFMTLIGGALVSVILFNSLTQPGRAAELRTYIWEAALQMFSERPLSGWGLFTFGKGLQTFASMPPATPHSHAHNMILHVLAELGIIGVGVMAMSAGVILWAMRHNWRTISPAERPILMGGIAAAVGFGVHHLFDTPFMMPAIALAGLCTLLVSVPLATPLPMVWAWRRRGHSASLVVAGVVLALVGFYDHTTYRTYISTIQAGLQAEDYLRTAYRLEAVIASDPANPIYYWQQGMLYGFAASIEGEIVPAQLGIVAFQNALQTEPQNAVLWVNLAALQWQTGDLQTAVASFGQAANAAPGSWQLALILGEHALNADQRTLACGAVQHALTLEPNLRLLKRGQRVLAACDRSPETLPPLEGLALVIEFVLTGAGDFDGAAQAWETAPIRTTAGYVVRAIIAHELGDSTGAETWLRQAEGARLADDAAAEGWVRYGQAILSRQTDPAVLAPIFAHTHITPDLFETDYPTGVNVGRATWLREVIARQFLPQVGYESRDILLLALLERP